MKRLILVLVLLLAFQFSLSSVIVEEHLDEEEEHHEEEEYHGEEDDHEGYDGFEALLRKTNSQHNDSLTEEAFQQVLNAVNENCLNSSQVFDILEVENGISEERFVDAALFLTYRMATRHYDEPCIGVTESERNVTSVDVFGAAEVCRRDIARLIKDAVENEKFSPITEGDECFGSASLLSECTTDRELLNDVAQKLVIAIVNGMCFLPEPSYFQEEVLEYLGVDEEGRVSEQNFVKLLEEFNIGEVAREDDHGHGDEDDHGHGDEDGHDDEHGDEDHEDEDHEDEDHADEDHEDEDHEDEDHKDEDHEDEDHEDEDHEDEDHEEEEGDHEESVAKRSVEDDHDDEEDDHHEDEEDDHSDEPQKCYSPTEILTIAGQNRDEEGNLILTMQGLTEVCPVILQQFITGACREGGHHDDERRRVDETYTQAKQYGYGTAAVLIISLLAFVGLLFFPAIGSTSFKMVMQFFIALGVGTLSGDALLHLIPEVVGLHAHGPGDDGHAHEEEEEEDQSYVYKLLVVVGGIYIFYLFENALRIYNHVRQSKSGAEPLSLHSHHHGTENHTHLQPGHETGKNHFMTRASISLASGEAVNGTSHQEENGEMKILDDPESNRPRTVCCGFTPVGLMVFIGDALHNFGDGLALGVAFSSSAVAGIGASIAIFCHELPHEFGDFAIYLKNGMSKCQALGINFLAACCAFIGLYVGLSVGQNEEARQWMLALVAGMFLYISLVDVLHEMIEEVSEDHPYLMFFLQNVGLLLGWAILLLLALFEEDIGKGL